MLSLVVLTAFNALVLLAPPGAISMVLELMPIPAGARWVLLFAVAINVASSMAFERWGVQGVVEVLDLISGHGGKLKKRMRDGKMYKVVDGRE